MIISEHTFKTEVFVYLWPMDSEMGKMKILTLFICGIR